MLYFRFSPCFYCMKIKELPERRASLCVGNNPNPKEEEVDRIANVERDSQALQPGPGMYKILKRRVNMSVLDLVLALDS